MSTLKLLSAAEQVAAHLRKGALQGRWGKLMPGVNRLKTELGVNHKTVEAALQILQKEGLLEARGAGRKRRIVQSSGAQRPMKLAILLQDESDRNTDSVIELHHALAGAGHVVIIPGQSLSKLNHNVVRIGRLVRQIEADAWVVVAGTREVLEWFSRQAVPAFAFFGRREGLRIAAAGPDKPPAYAAAARQLIGLGHRRIVMLVRSLRRLPQPGQCEQAVLDELTASGIETGTFNLPDWQESAAGLHELLIRLFQVTPPTALLVDEAPLFIAVEQFLAVQGIRVPRDVSLVCTDPSPVFAWCTPSVAHIGWDSRAVIVRVLRWVAAVGRGRVDVRQPLFPAEYIAGGTVGAAPAHGMEGR